MEVCYDARDDQDASYQLGCGGLVNICLLPLGRENHFLALDELRQALNAGQSGFWQLLMPKAGEAPATLEARFLPWVPPQPMSSLCLSPPMTFAAPGFGVQKPGRTGNRAG